MIASTGQNAGTRGTLLAAGLIVVATVGAFSNSCGGPFVFDDYSSIEKNATIRQLWPLTDVLSPPRNGETVTGRPLLNLSFAINYAIGGTSVWGYHATNVAIHVAAALLLFGLLRRTFLLPSMRGDWREAAVPLALTITLLWAVHPLQTESVTYTVQRAESLVGLFYLLTLYALLRGATTERPYVWYVISASACLLGMVSKEIMVSAPLIAILYDRTFIAGSFREALRRRFGLYLALAASWPLLNELVYLTSGRGGTAGLDAGLPCWTYLGMQCQAIIDYLRLCVWPSPLVLDYGKGLAEGLLPPALCSVALMLLAAATTVALFRRPRLGFLGVCFFAILAPTSSIVPVVTQPMAQHRMYLPLAAIITLVVCGVYIMLRKISQHGRGWRIACSIVSIAAVAAATSAFAAATYQRNRDYRDAVSIWADTVRKVPGNARARHNLGMALLEVGRSDEALTELREARRLSPREWLYSYNFGRVAKGLACLDNDIKRYREALVNRPDSADGCRSLAWLLATCPAKSRRNGAEAIELARRADRLVGGQKPDVLDAVAAAYAETGRFTEALDASRRALELAERQGLQRLAHQIRHRIEGYEAGKPFREKLPGVE